MEADSRQPPADAGDRKLKVEWDGNLFTSGFVATKTTCLTAPFYCFFTAFHGWNKGLFGHQLFLAGRDKAARGGHSQGGVQHQNRDGERPDFSPGPQLAMEVLLRAQTPCWCCAQAQPAELHPAQHSARSTLAQILRCSARQGDFQSRPPPLLLQHGHHIRAEPGQRPLWGALEGLHCCTLKERGASSAAGEATKAETTALFLSVNLQPGKDRGLLSAVFL